MSRPDEGLIHAWLDGELDAAESARIEALVQSDPAWSAAAAEARGLIAATSRIVSALDGVPANVIPATRAPETGTTAKVIPLAAKPRGTPWWALRAAAVLVVVAGTVVVMRNGTPEVVEVGAGLATSAVDLKDSAVAPLAAAPTPPRSADARVAQQATSAPRATPLRSDAAAGRASAADADAARQLVAEEKVKEAESAKLSVAGVAAPASAAAGERRALGFAAKAVEAVSAAEQCFREPVVANSRELGVMHRVRVDADSVARAADERVQARARTETSANLTRPATTAMRVRGDTLIIVGAEGTTPVRALLISCPSP